MSMGIGYGLSEQLLFDEKTGKPLNNNLLDYKLSTVMDHPDLEALFVENASRPPRWNEGSGGATGHTSGASHPRRYLQRHRRFHRHHAHHPPCAVPRV